MSSRRYDQDTSTLIIDVSRARRDASGPLVVPARLSLSENVQDYGDHREYRPASEVFDARALASFEGVPLTVGHPQDFVSMGNLDRVSVGYVRNVHRDGAFMAGNLVVHDDGVARDILDARLVELSMGYAVRDEWTTGMHRGVQYERIQRDIRGNHAALGPRNWGRAGNEVRVL